MSKQVIVTSDNVLSDKQIEKIEKDLKEKGLDLIILPKNLKVVRQELIKELGYKIFTKDDYKKYKLSKLKNANVTKNTIKNMDKIFDRISKGYKFIIAAVTKDDLRFYSIPYFNEHILGGKNIEETTSKVNSKDLTVKLNLDTTEFEYKLNETEKQLDRIIDKINFVQDLDKVKNIVEKVK